MYITAAKNFSRFGRIFRKILLRMHRNQCRSAIFTLRGDNNELINITNKLISISLDKIQKSEPSNEWSLVEIRIIFNYCNKYYSSSDDNIVMFTQSGYFVVIRLKNNQLPTTQVIYIYLIGPDF